MVRLFLKYIVYKLFARHKKGHGIHSPFVFNFIQNVLQNKQPTEDLSFIKDIIIRLKKVKKKITVTDYGAGSKTLKKAERKVSKIAKTSASDGTTGVILHRMAKYFKPATIVELGTSLGIGSLFLASANKQTPVVTVEGCPEIAQIAKKIHDKSGLKNIKLINDRFDVVIDSILSESGKPILVYLDGNHRFKPTIEYFEKCLQYFSDDSILVIGDIHWSGGMKKAWKTISKDERVKVSIDLFYLGILFFNEGLSKQHFVIKC